MLPQEIFYESPLDCAFFNASWGDRYFLQPAPAGLDLKGPCWIWTGWNNGKPGGAYGKVRVGKQAHYLHRVMWERSRNLSLQCDDEIDHLCRVRLCFSPHHIECTDREENLRRRDWYAARVREPDYDPDLADELIYGYKRNAA